MKKNFLALWHNEITRYRYLIVVVALLIFVYAGMPAYTIAADDMSDNYRDSRRDWYFYKKELINPDADEKKAKQKPEPSVSGMQPQDLWNMHPDKFKELLETAHKRMVQYPDDDNIMSEWLYLKDIARRKSLAATNAEMAYVQRHPEYNMNKDVPVINKGKAVLYREQQEAVESRLKQEKGNYGLLFFYSPNCGYCIEQSSILKVFINKYKWDIKGVDVTSDPDAKAQFNIGTTPTLLLVQRSSSESMTIAVGVISLDEIEGTIYKAIRYLNKEISPEQWNVYDFQKDGLMDPLATVKSKPEASKSIPNNR
ncbi:MAG: conjugal transfer protein TraF [Syntrophaceae bacterium]